MSNGHYAFKNRFVKRLDVEVFVIKGLDMEGAGTRMSWGQVAKYISWSQGAHTGRAPHAMPLGYINFAQAYNADTRSIGKFCIPGEHPGTPLSAEYFQVSPEVATSQAELRQIAHQQDREVIDATQNKLFQDMLLIEAVESVRRKRENL
ncbi:hypothetical protein H0H87_011889 [Tephrocybe sp. NHM501043]|nr:hypothetical protein H0H87_011889 [Tephrocybe sp. NHM501043]